MALLAGAAAELGGTGSQLSTLAVGSCRLDNAIVAGLAAGLAGLRELDVGSNCALDDGVLALVTASCGARLMQLRLDGRRVSRSTLEGLRRRSRACSWSARGLSQRASKDTGKDEDDEWADDADERAAYAA